MSRPQYFNRASMQAGKNLARSSAPTAVVPTAQEEDQFPATQPITLDAFAGVTLGKLQDFVISLGDDIGHANSSEAAMSVLMAALRDKSKSPVQCSDEEELQLIAKICLVFTGRSSLRKSVKALGARQGKRDALVACVLRQVEMRKRIRSLPLTFFYLLIFMCLVIFRLHIFERQEHERGLEAWVTGNSLELYGPYLLEHVNNIESFWAWVDDSALLYMFSDVKVEAGSPQVHIASTSLLLGDLKFERRYTNGTEVKEWLLHTAPAQTYLAAAPNDFLGAARAGSSYLKSSGWLSKDVSEIKITFCTYSERARMFSKIWLTMPFEEYGLVRPRIVASSVTSVAYRHKAGYVTDIIYAVILLYFVWDECADCVSWRRHARRMAKVTSNVQTLSRQVTDGSLKRIRSGDILKSSRQYFDVFAALKRFTLVSGMCIIAVWMFTWNAVNSDVLRNLLDSSGRLKPEVNLLDTETETLEQVADAVVTVWRFFFVLMFVMAANVVSILFRFFKAFGANPRLETVTETLKRSVGDIVHFALVFMTLFLCYAALGHMLFGQDLPEFFTLSAAIDTSLQTLFGDFDWYVQFNGYKLTNLPSGMPRPLLGLWFYTFMFLMMLVLLNMVVAIIFERYQEVIEHMKEMSDVPPIWTQFARFMANRKTHKGFLGQSKILVMLHDRDSPAHPQQVVTEESLLAAFPGMPRPQAQFLMEKTLGTMTDEVRKASKSNGVQQPLFQQALPADVKDELSAMKKDIAELRREVISTQRAGEAAVVNVKPKEAQP